MFEAECLTKEAASQAAYRKAIAEAAEVLCKALPEQAYSGKSASALEELLTGEVFPQTAIASDVFWERMGMIVAESVNVTHASTVAHLHCPPVIPALAAEVVLSGLNQSMDSFDQAPVATILEEKIVQALCSEVELGAEASGVFTSGGSQSNYMGLLLARDSRVERHWSWTVQSKGLPVEANRLRILCSEAAHFTAEKSAAQLGLGTESVVRVAVDKEFRMDCGALRAALANLEEKKLVPTAIVGTAGTTDFGSIDSLYEIASIARRVGAWFHVDAAYGSALLFSPKHREKLRGIEMADSVSLDFHKLFWQPISCAAFLLREAGNFRFMKFNADYLNPELHEEMGIPNLVTRSVATTRRFDALKLWASFQMLGRRKFAEMIDATIQQAAQAAKFIRADIRLELIHEPTMGCVVFRYKPSKATVDADKFNAVLRQQLFETGEAVIGHTIVHGRQCLKLTCMNPMTTTEQIEGLLRMIVSAGEKLEKDGFTG
jgi:L-2,4-diaminobutyrate decarboxylase